MRHYLKDRFGYILCMQMDILISKEALPLNMPEARGVGFTTRLSVDDKQVRDSITRQLMTGFLVYLQNKLISWRSNKQMSDETLSSRIKLMAMKTATKYMSFEI